MPGAAGPPPCDPRDGRSRGVKYGNGAGHVSSSPETGFLTATDTTNFGPSYTTAFLAFVLAMGCSSVIYRCASPQPLASARSRIIIDRPRAAGRYGGEAGNQPVASGGAGVGGKPLFTPAAGSTWLERLMATYERRIWVGVLVSPCWTFTLFLKTLIITCTQPKLSPLNHAHNSETSQIPCNILCARR
jgi:hypothetical protein